MVKYPRVSVVIATQDRAQLLRHALDGVIAQDYLGPIDIHVVYDNFTPDHSLATQSGQRNIYVHSNTRSPGLAGARNTGILASHGNYVAFCDDDDRYKPAKISKQIELIQEVSAQGCVSGIEIHYGDKLINRVPETRMIDARRIKRDRMTGAHPSSYLFERDFLTNSLQLVDEQIPFGYGEDYDLLIRAAEAGNIAVLGEPAVEVLWHKGGSYFSRRWEAMDAGIHFLTLKHPGLLTSSRTASWLLGQRAFALSSLKGRRSEGMRIAAESIKLNWRQPRGYLALGVACRVLSSQWVVNRLNERGKGI